MNVILQKAYHTSQHFPPLILSYPYLVWAIQKKLCFHALWVKYSSTFKLFPQGFDSQLAGPGLLRISFLSHNLQRQLSHCQIREGTDTHQNIEDKAFCCGWGKRHLLPGLQFLTTPRLAPLIGRQENGARIIT